MVYFGYVKGTVRHRHMTTSPQALALYMIRLLEVRMSWNDVSPIVVNSLHAKSYPGRVAEWKFYDESGKFLISLFLQSLCILLRSS
jgi:hypothetical protein